MSCNRNEGRICDGMNFRPGYLLERLYDVSNKRYYTIDLRNHRDKILEAKKLAEQYSKQISEEVNKTKCAILDTGMMTHHPLIKPYLKASENFSQDDDTEDHHGHGTYVTLAFLETCNPSTVELYNIKIGNGYGEVLRSDMIKAISWCAENKMTKANISAGFVDEGCQGNCDVCTAARNASDVSVVVSAGNYGPFKTVCPAKAEFYSANNITSVGAQYSYSGQPGIIAPDHFGFRPV